MEVTATKPIFIYSRKSKFTGKGESIENQIELCRQYIRTHYGEEAAENAIVYEDEGFSGKNLERPKFKEMMQAVKNQETSAIVCYRLDRISRNIGNFANLIEELADLEVSFISIKEQFDTSSPMGRAMMYIASVFSQLERETIAERIRDNMHELAKTGRWLGGTTPTGYESESVKSVTIDGKTKKACKLKTIPEEAKLIRLIFDKFLETNSLTKTETFLIQKGFRTKNDKLFTRFAIKGILLNPVYMIADEDAYDYLVEHEVDLFSEKTDFDGRHGIMAYNRTLQRTGKANQIRPMEEWIVSVGKHKGFISGKRWIQVQACLEQNRSKSYRKPRSNVALLSGLLYCGNCGDYMRPKLSKRLNAQGEQVYSYLCSLKERSRCHSCNSKNVNGNLLDAAIIEEVKKLSDDSTEFMRQLEQSKKVLEGSRAEYDENIAQLKQSLEENEAEIRGLVSTLGNAAGSAAEPYILQQVDELHEKSEALKRQISELEGLTKEHALADIEFDIFRDMLSSFKDTIDNMSVEQKRAAIRTVISRVEWDGKNVHIYLFGAQDNGKADMTGIRPADLENAAEPSGMNSK
ncbi:MAG: recombinase family protein [Clostridiales bacterium]|nr:recombinase family protein [Clostridiales bacterium]